MTALYAQLESLTTTVAQLRREAPRKAAMEYAAQLRRILQEDEEDGVEGEGDEVEEKVEEEQSQDVEGMDVDTGAGSTQQPRRKSESRRRNRNRPDPAWKLDIPLGTEEETERWRSGDMADIYENALRTLQRLQGEGGVAEETGGEGNALATTVGKAERAGRAAEVVESM